MSKPKFLSRVVILSCVLLFAFVIYKIVMAQWKSGVIVMNIVSKHQPLNEVQEIRAAVGTRNVSDYISKTEKSVRLNWHKYNWAAKNSPTALIIVASVPEAKFQRMVIRDTWYKFCKMSNAKIVFFMGLPKNGEIRNIVLESMEYDDIVLDDFPEDFYKMSLKVLRMFKWFMDFYQDSKVIPKYLVKVDQDVFLHVPNIVTHLESLKLKPNEQYIGGILYTNTRVTRRINSKYFVPLDIYDKPKFPPFLGGSCYFLSANLVPRIFQASFKVPLFHLEHVYISGMIAHETLGVKLQGIQNPVMIESSRNLSTAIKYRNNIWNSISYHKVEPDLMQYLYGVASRHME